MWTNIKSLPLVLNQVLARLIPEGPLNDIWILQPTSAFAAAPDRTSHGDESRQLTYGVIYSWRRTQSDEFTATKSRRQTHVDEFTSANLVINSQTNSWPRTHWVKLQAENSRMLNSPATNSWQCLSHLQHHWTQAFIGVSSFVFDFYLGQSNSSNI